MENLELLRMTPAEFDTYYAQALCRFLDDVTEIKICGKKSRREQRLFFFSHMVPGVNDKGEG